MRKREIFTTVLQSSPEITQIPKRELDILKARYEDTPIALVDRSWFVGQDGRFPWKEKILIWNAIIGIRNSLPDQAQETLLLDFLINEYGGLSFAEIELAFRMNLLGEFGNVIEHYNQLDVRYLTQIVNAYKGKRVEADNKYKEICHRLQYLPSPAEDPQILDYKSGKSVYLKYRTWLKGDTVIGLKGDYSFLLRIGILEDNPDEMQEALTLVGSEMAGEVENDLASVGQIMIDVLQATIEDRAQAHIVLNLFEKLKADGTDFQQLIRSCLTRTHEANTGGRE